MKTGHIRIKDKVYFEPDGLEKPDKKTYDKAKIYNFENLIIQKYEASKQLIEVVNVFWGKISQKWLCWGEIKGKWEYSQINNQPCKAKVTGETCTIVELN